MPHIETSRHCSAYDYCFLFQSQMIQFASKKCKPRMVWTFRMVEECSCCNCEETMFAVFVLAFIPLSMILCPILPDIPAMAGWALAYRTGHVLVVLCFRCNLFLNQFVSI